MGNEVIEKLQKLYGFLEEAAILAAEIRDIGIEPKLMNKIHNSAYDELNDCAELLVELKGD